jgi:prepilin-type N-terminal cleavage/methylation domain-containing protein
MNKPKGFTLLELVLVMVILGILAAFAIPKFFNFQSQARKATIEGLAGALRESITLIHAASIAHGDLNADVQMSDGTKIKVAQGYPKATRDGIGKVLDYSYNYHFYPDYDTDLVTFRYITKPGKKIEGMLENCYVQYSVKNISEQKFLTIELSGC